MNSISIPLSDEAMSRRRLAGFIAMCAIPFVLAWSLLGVLFTLRARE